MSIDMEALGGLVLGVGSGGVVGATLTAWSARKKVPAEVDNIIINGAELTVQAALAVASAEAARADRAEAREAELERRLEAALAQVEALQVALNAVRSELHAIKEVHTK